MVCTDSRRRRCGDRSWSGSPTPRRTLRSRCPYRSWIFQPGRRGTPCFSSRTIPKSSSPTTARACLQATSGGAAIVTRWDDSWHGFRSAWLPASLLEKDRQRALADALCAGSRRWHIALHFNKGLAGAPADVLAAAKDTAMHPVVLEAFALAIIGGGSPPAFADIPGHAPDVTAARRRAWRHQPGDGCIVTGRTAPGIVRRGERFLRAHMAASVLGIALSALSRGEKEDDPAPLLRPPRCRK